MYRGVTGIGDSIISTVGNNTFNVPNPQTWRMVHFCKHPSCARGDVVGQNGAESSRYCFTSEPELVDHGVHHHIGAFYDCFFCIPPTHWCCVHEIMEHMAHCHPEIPRPEPELVQASMTEDQRTLFYKYWYSYAGHAPSFNPEDVDLSVNSRKSQPIRNVPTSDSAQTNGNGCDLSGEATRLSSAAASYQPSGVSQDWTLEVPPPSVAASSQWQQFDTSCNSNSQIGNVESINPLPSAHGLSVNRQGGLGGIGRGRGITPYFSQIPVPGCQGDAGNVVNKIGFHASGSQHVAPHLQQDGPLIGSASATGSEDVPGTSAGTETRALRDFGGSARQQLLPGFCGVPFVPCSICSCSICIENNPAVAAEALDQNQQAVQDRIDHQPPLVFPPNSTSRQRRKLQRAHERVQAFQQRQIHEHVLHFATADIRNEPLPLSDLTTSDNDDNNVEEMW